MVDRVSNVFHGVCRMFLLLDRYVYFLILSVQAEGPKGRAR